MDRYFVAGVLMGLIIATIWRNINRPKGTPPDKNVYTVDFREHLKTG